MLQVKVVCQNCNTPGTFAVEKTDGTAYGRCKRCFKKVPIQLKGGLVVEVQKAKEEKAPPEKKPKDEKAKEEKKQKDEKAKEEKPKEDDKSKDGEVTEEKE